MNIQVADYEILERMAEVEDEELYVAVPPARLGLDESKVLVKVIRSVNNTDAVRRATEELRIFATVASPHLATLRDAGQDDETLFYAMDFPDDGILKAPSRPLELGERLEAVASAARGAHALHEAGVVHRSIAPSRILLDRSGARLAGLGLARFATPGQVLNTMPHVRQIDYLDPALLRGSSASRASDIWSLGATLHFAATGGLPLYPVLPDDNALGTVRAVLGGQPAVDPGVPEPIAAVVRSCIAAEPAERLTTAAEVADRIEQVKEVA